MQKKKKIGEKKKSMINAGVEKKCPMEWIVMSTKWYILHGRWFCVVWVIG